MIGHVEVVESRTFCRLDDLCAETSLRHLDTLIADITQHTSFWDPERGNTRPSGTLKEVSSNGSKAGSASNAICNASSKKLPSKK